MMKKIRILMILASLFIWGACSDSDEGNGTGGYDPSMPAHITTFLPDSGVIRSKFLAKGSNFGNSTDSVAVFFNERKSQILALNDTMIYCLVPKQEQGYNTVKVVVRGDTMIYEDQKFFYRVQSSVSTVTGKAREQWGSENGTLAKSTLAQPYTCAIDADDNLLMADWVGSRIRMASINEDKVITIGSGYGSTENGIFKFAMNQGRNMIYFTTVNKPIIYYMDKLRDWEPRKLVDLSSKINSRIYSCALDSEEKYLYFRANGSKFYRIPSNTTNRPLADDLEELDVQIGSASTDCSMITFNPIDGNFYCSVTKDQKVYRIKGSGTNWVCEDFVGSTVGFTDGKGDEVRFRNPQGMAVDSEGNMYIADVENQVIRKITLSGVVTRVAGDLNKAKGNFYDGDPDVACFDYPYDVCVGTDDAIYIADRWNSVIRKLAIE